MKLTKLKGIANDLADHLNYLVWQGPYKDIAKKVETNVLEKKDSLDKLCDAFFRERLPESFDYNRIEKIVVQIYRSMTVINVKVMVSIEGKTFTGGKMAMMT